MSLKLLFVCTGNTCRSPMAEALAKKLFGDGLKVSSAGLSASENEEASPHSIEALKDYGITLQNHRARQVSEKLVAEADWIIPMTRAHEAQLKRLFPQYAEKIYFLGHWGESKKDIIDPYGGSFDVYRKCAGEIAEMLKSLKSALEERE